MNDPNQFPSLRTPGGRNTLILNGQALEGGGSSYPIENGVPHLYDDADVSPFLSRDYALFKNIHDRPDLRSPNHDEITAAYQRAKFVNTNWMFSAIDYDDLQRGSVAEIGVGSADLIKQWAGSVHEAFAVDFYTWEMADSLTEHVASGGAAFIPVSAVMARLPFADSSLDIVYLHAAIHHALPADHGEFEWSNPNNMVDCLKEIRRVLKRDGAFFLTGEGIYDNDVAPEGRVYEVNCASNEGLPYEAHYTIPEYEEAYRASGMYPTVFAWQVGLKLILDFYVNKQAVRAIGVDDDVSTESYGRVAALASERLAGICALPAWMHWRI